jgi:hypothetical protein
VLLARAHVEGLKGLRSAARPRRASPRALRFLAAEGPWTSRWDQGSGASSTPPAACTAIMRWRRLPPMINSAVKPMPIAANHA